MKTTNILRLWISAVVILGSSTGLALSAESTALHEVKIGYTSTSISVFPIEFARRKGFLRDEGLNVVMIVMRTNVIMNALLTRGIDYGTPATSVIRAAANDLPVKAVAVLTGRPDYFLAARKEFKSLKDLKGKRIAIGTFGAAADIALRVVLRQDGLDPERDVIRLQMGGGDSRFAALVGGTVDATILNFPFNLQAEKLGFNVLLWLGERLEMPLSGVGVRDETIQKNPGQVFGLVRAIYRCGGFCEGQPGRDHPGLHGLGASGPRARGQELRVGDEELAGQPGHFRCGDQSRGRAGTSGTQAQGADPAGQGA